MYPIEFSIQHQARIEAEKIQAANRLSNTRNSTLAIGYGSTEEPMRKALRQYVLDVFTEFAAVACELGRNGIWSALEVEKQSWQFICTLADEASSELGYDSKGRSISLTDYAHRLISEQAHHFRESTEWRIFQMNRLTVANIQSQPQPPPLPQVPPPQTKTIGEELDEIVLAGSRSHEQLADKIGISRTAYFEVKAGRGGKKAKAKVRLYLSDLESAK